MDELLKTEKHRLYGEYLYSQNHAPVIAIGSAGTGKTYNAVKAAIDWIGSDTSNIFIGARPNVAFADEIGYLPGTEAEKIAPWVRPMRQNFEKLGMDAAYLSMLEQKKRVQFHPLAFIQGLTFDNAFILVDECFRDGSEVLTQRGFIDFKELNDDDLVAQYEDSGNIKFVNPSRRITRHHKGKMVNIVKDHFYSSVTPNHRRVFSDHNDALKVELASEGFRTNWGIPKSGIKVGGNNESKSLIGLACMLQADGNANFKKGVAYWKIGVKKVRKIKRIEEIFKDLGVKYTKYDPDAIGRVSFYIGRMDDHPVMRFIDEQTKTFNKEIVIGLDFESMSAFQDELIFWDGSSKGHSDVYCTTNKENAELAQTVAHMIGFSANINTSKDNRKESYKDYYRVYYSAKTKTTLQKVKDTEEDYDGLVHCVTVPSGMIMVRQGGYVHVSGNCQNMTFGQLKGVLTRTGKNSRVVLCGDIKQTSPLFQDSGLAELVDMIDALRVNANVVEFTLRDCMRSQQCKDWLRAFEKWEEQ